MAGYLLGIDQGTTTCRAVLYDLQGRAVAEAYREVYPHHPRSDWAEMEPEDWWRATVEVIREILSLSHVEPSAIAAVGISGLQHAMVPIDREGRPLARAMLWMDQRCAPQVEWMIEQHGEVLRRVMGEGRWLTTTYSAPKLRWWRENCPELIEATWKFLLPKDYLRYRLTGAVATDPSDAGGTFLYHPRKGGWAAEILEIIEVPEDKLPPIRQPMEIAGRVHAQAAEETGLAQGTPVAVGAGDVLSTLIGANATIPDRAYLYLGTAAWLSMPTYSRSFLATHERPAMSDGSRHHFGATATTGAALRWFGDLFMGGRGPGVHSQLDYEALLAEAEGVEPGAEGVIFLPHLMGERATNDPQAKGVFFGLTLAHGRAHLLRAILEGCAFLLRQIVDLSGGEPPRELLALGGGAKSPLWLQIIADVMGLPVLVPRVTETGTLGAAILAGVGVGLYESVEGASERLVEIVSCHQPRAEYRARYDALYSLYRELDELLTPYFRRVPIG